MAVLFDPVNLITSSYAFHKTIESPIQFARREWQALAVFGGSFVLLLLFLTFNVRPAYYYPLIRTDTLLYYLKSLTFAETGHTAARYAVNARPFHYQAMPGVLRSPLMLAFGDFDSRLRAIQISNIALVGLTATLYAYVLSWAAPRKLHWLAIGFAFGFTLLSPEWVTNVFEMLADAPYAFFSILCVILVARILPSSRPLRAHWLAIGALLVCFVIAFLTRFTAPVLIVYAAALAAGRIREHEASQRTTVSALAGVAVILAILVAVNWETISARYLADMHMALVRGSKSGMLVNLFGAALPSQIIPDFSLAFGEYPVTGKWALNIRSTPRDLSVLAVGFCISCAILWGMWRSRDRFAPEIAYMLVVLPVLALMLQSTSRYMMAYQPLIWIFFFTGVGAITEPVAARAVNRPRAVKRPRAALAGLALVFVIGAGLVFLRAKKMKLDGARLAAVSFGRTRSHASEIASTFESLRGFMEKLPRERSLLIGGRGTFGRWKVISGVDYYLPDSTFASVVSAKDTYIVIECATDDSCNAFDAWDSRVRAYLDKRGKYQLDPVFLKMNAYAKVKVYRITQPQAVGH